LKDADILESVICAYKMLLENPETTCGPVVIDSPKSLLLSNEHCSILTVALDAREIVVPFPRFNLLVI